LLEIVATKDGSKLLIMCDDCGIQWPDPNSAIHSPSTTMVSNKDRYNKLVDATIEEIISIGWKDYLNE
jgi:hypothetical protein